MEPEAVKKKRITLADVARHAGVSVQTASHVMADNRTARLPESTRARVREAARSLGYVPNRVAQAMRYGTTNIVSLWMPVDRLHANNFRTLRLLVRHARQSGKEILIVGLESTQAYGTDSSLPSQWPVDGMIAVDAGRAMRKFRENPANQSIPLVVFGAEEFPNGDSVCWDVRRGAYEAVGRMIGAGARSIVHLTLDWILRDFPIEQRRTGYGQAMSEHGLTPRFLGAAEESSRSAEESMESFLRENGVPEGVFCFTDVLAIGAIRALLKRGVRVPEDCQVWGFGDLPEAEDYRIAVSSVRLPLEQCADQAWTWLMERIAVPSLPTRSLLLPMSLVERESTRQA